MARSHRVGDAQVFALEGLLKKRPTHDEGHRSNQLA
jgi:hypothetical protein